MLSVRTLATAVALAVVTTFTLSAFGNHASAKGPEDHYNEETLMCELPAPEPDPPLNPILSNPTLAAVGNDPEVGAEIAETAVNAVANFLSNAVDTAVDVVNHVDQEFNEFLEDDDHIVHQVLTIQQQVLNPGPAYPGPDPDDSYMEISAEQAVHDDAVLDPFDPGSQVEATINFINCAIACEHEGSDPPPSGGGGGGGGPIYITP